MSEIWGFLSPFIAAMAGGLIALLFDRKRARDSHQLTLDYEAEVAARSVRREKLLMAYEWIDAAEPTRLRFLKLSPEEAFERTQLGAKGMGLVKLFGSEKLCGLVDEYIKMLNGEAPFHTDIFMNELRDELRTQYGLDATSSRYKWLDFKRPDSVDVRSSEEQETS